MNRQQQRSHLKQIINEFKSRVKQNTQTTRQQIGKLRSKVFVQDDGTFTDFHKLKKHTIGDEITELDAICFNVVVMNIEWKMICDNAGLSTEDKVKIALLELFLA